VVVKAIDGPCSEKLFVENPGYSICSDEDTANHQHKAESKHEGKKFTRGCRRLGNIRKGCNIKHGNSQKKKVT